MANMDITQRTQVGRIDLSVPTTGVRVRSLRPLVIYTVIVSIALVGLGYAAVDAIDGWPRLAVLGAIVATAIGGMIAIDPQRRG
jgi:fatty acid desaturase